MIAKSTFELLAGMTPEFRRETLRAIVERQAIGKTHEQRIAELELTVAELALGLLSLTNTLDTVVGAVERLAKKVTP